MSKKALIARIMLTLIMVFILFPCVVSASTAADTKDSKTPPATTVPLPWEGPLTQIQNSLTGPVAVAVSTITAIVTGIMIGLGEGGAAGRKMLQIVCGLAIALSGGGFITNMFGKGVLM